MPKSILLLLLSMLSFNLSGQNWSPIVPASKLNFKHTDSAFITNTLWVDSVKTNGSDAVFYLNRVVLDCDTCPTNFYGVHYKLGRQGQFAQKTMLQSASGICRFWGNRPFTLLPLASEGTSWLFDTLQQITASVQSVQEAAVFGQTDSVKTIALSDGSMIRLSKNFGLLEFPDRDQSGRFVLSGIQGQGIGEQVPVFRDIFNFVPGDLYQQEILQHQSVGHELITQKVTILARQDIGDTIVYQVARVGKHYYHIQSHMPTQSYFRDTTTWIFVDSASHYANAFPNQLLYPIWAGGNQVHSVHTRIDITGGRIQKACGGYRNYFSLQPNSDYVKPYEDAWADFYDIWKYSPGLGVVFGIKGSFSYFTQTQLTASIINGDTTGVVLPDTELMEFVPGDTLTPPPDTMQAPIPDDWNFMATPNLVIDNSLEITAPFPIPEDMTLRVVNLSGQVVYSEKLPAGIKRKTIQLPSGENGIYLLRIEGEHYRKVLRILRN